MSDRSKKKLCLACSSGGHFLEIYFLKDFWKDYDRFWVTFLAADNTSLLQGEETYAGYGPTNRNVVNLIRNLFLAHRILTKERPDVIVSTGAGLAVPFIYVAKFLKIKTIYIESGTRVNQLSMSGRLICPVVDHLLVQWPDLAKKVKKAKYMGRIL